jgi:hypothetical protein
MGRLADPRARELVKKIDVEIKKPRRSGAKSGVNATTS